MRLSSPNGDQRPKTKHALTDVFFCVAGRTGFEYHPLMGTCDRKQNASITERVFSVAGRTGFEPATEDFAPVTA